VNDILEMQRQPDFPVLHGHIGNQGVGFVLQAALPSLTIMQPAEGAVDPNPHAAWVAESIVFMTDVGKVEIAQTVLRVKGD